jgi:GT2 family glycosyltransferase
MGMLTNRLRTITGENAGVSKSISRLFYYTFSTNKLSKVFAKLIQKVSSKADYQMLLKEETAAFTEAEITSLINAFTKAPTITIVVVGDDLEKAKHTFKSIEQQVYRKFQCFVSSKKVGAAEGQNILNDVSELKACDLVMVLNAGDVLNSRCLFYVAQAYAQSSGSPKLIYFNQDHITETGEQYAPQFKPGWSPDLLKEQNYIQHAVVATFLVESIDLNNTDAVEIIQSVLGRQSLLRSEVVAIDKVLLSESGLAKKMVETIASPRVTDHANDLISIVIPTKNKTDLVKQCIQSIIDVSTYKNYEIILVDNRSDEADFFEYTETLISNPQIRFKRVFADMEFNFSALINLGVANSSGTYILLLNNDVKVITPNWMELMLDKARQQHVGAVGVKLLYPNETIQHAGIVLSQEGICEHVFVGKKQEEVVYGNVLNTTRNYLALTAACLMVSKPKYTEVGGFEEQFKVEYNDVDFCLKLYEQGYYNVYEPRVKLFHYESASRRHPHSDKKSFTLHLSETEFMKEKWARYLAHDPYHIFKHSNRI